MCYNINVKNNIPEIKKRKFNKYKIMTITKTQKIIGSVVILVVLLALYIAFDRHSKNTEVGQVSTTVATSTDGVSVVSQGNNTYTITALPATGNVGGGVPQPIPNLSAPIVFSPSVSLTDSEKQAALQKISSLQAALRKNPADFDSWIDLGIYEKITGYYDNTIAAWQYASKLSPTDFISLGDLGDLYAYFLKDTATSEKYYNQAIKNDPTRAYLYVQLAQIEHDIENNPAKAMNTINQGLSQIPNNQQLINYKATLSQ
jgi:hypothetical protein